MELEYVRDREVDTGKNCAVVKAYELEDRIQPIEEIKSIDDFEVKVSGKRVRLLNAKAGSGKTRYMMKKATEDVTTNYLFLAPYKRDCEVLSGMCPYSNIQYGRSEDRTFDDNSNIQ